MPIIDKSWIWNPTWVETVSDPCAGRLVHFRKELWIEKAPEHPELIEVTADTRYKLYINGSLVAFGPVRGDQQTWFYDTIDIQPHLKQGSNRLAICVLRFFAGAPGATSFVRSPCGGLLIRNANENNHVNVSGNSNWQTAIDYSTTFPMGIKHDDFLHIYERVDRGLDKDLKWMPAKPQKFLNAFGVTAPWRLAPRTIPFQTLTQKQIKAIHNIRSCVSTTAWERVFKIGSHDLNHVKLPAGTKHRIEIEVDHHMTAFVKFRFLQNRAVGSTLKITYTECYEDPPNLLPYSRCKGDRCDTSKSLIGPEDQYCFGQSSNEISSSYDEQGDQEEIYAPYHFRAFRFMAVEIDVSGEDDLVMTGLDVFETLYPLHIAADISVSEEHQNLVRQLWTTSIRTLNNCMHDSYEDCPFYEQFQYAMDTRSSILFTYVLSGDDRLARQAIVQFRNSFQPAIGLTASRAPAQQLQIIPHFSLFWILMLVDHYEYFADSLFIRQMIPVATAVLETFNQRIDSDIGLVKHPSGTGQWDFVDWAAAWAPFGIPPAGERTGYLSFSSMLYAYTLQRFGILLDSLSQGASAREYHDRAMGLVKAVREHCFDGFLVSDGLQTGKVVNQDYSQHGQIWGVLCGVLSKEEGVKALEEVLKESSSSHKLTPASIAMRFYTFRAISLAGDSLYSQNFHGFWQPWKEQLEQNLTTWVEDNVNQRSDCHAWGSSPIYEFMTEVVGIRPAKPRFAVISFQPRVELFSSLDAKMPIGGSHGEAVLIAHVKWFTVDDGVRVLKLTIMSKSGIGVSKSIAMKLPGQEVVMMESSSIDLRVRIPTA